MVATMLTEIERFEGVLILATNRPYATPLHRHCTATAPLLSQWQAGTMWQHPRRARRDL